MRKIWCLLAFWFAAHAWATTDIDLTERWPDGQSIMSSCYGFPYWRQHCPEGWSSSLENPVWCMDMSVLLPLRDGEGRNWRCGGISFAGPDEYPQQWSDGWFYPAWCGTRSVQWRRDCREAWRASGEHPVWCNDQSIFYHDREWRYTRGSPDWCNIQPIGDIADGALIAARNIRKAAADPQAVVFELIYFMRDGASEGDGLFCFMHYTNDAAGRRINRTSAFRVAGKIMRTEAPSACRGGSGLYLTKLVRAREAANERE